MPLTTKQLIVRNGKRIFVKMMAGEPWLRIAVTGQKRHGKLSRSTLWTTLNRFVQKACKGELDTLAVAEEVGDEYDPMQAGVAAGPPHNGCWLVESVRRLGGDDDGDAGRDSDDPSGGGVALAPTPTSPPRALATALR